MKALTSLNVKRGLLRIWLVLSVLFILVVAFNQYGPIRDEFYEAGFVHGLTMPDNTYGNESLVPASCNEARGKEDVSLFTGYAKLSIDSRIWMVLNSGAAQPVLIDPTTFRPIDQPLAIAGSHASNPPPPPGYRSSDVWDQAAVSLQWGNLDRQVADLHVDPSVNHGLNEVWCWYRVTNFRRLFPEYENVQDKKLIKALYDKAGLKGLLTFSHVFHPWTLLLQSIAFAIGIPFGVLALGSACYWALAGFKIAS